MSRSQTTFSPIRSFLWPIHNYELAKIIPLSLMAFFIGFNYNILRTMKEALLVTAESSGAEVIPFIKVWGIVPGAILMTYIYSRLNNKLKQERIFYAMVTIFLTFFALFTFVIYPIRDALHPHQFADRLQTLLPTGFKGLIAMFRYWTFSSFYIMSELWSSAILSMLFWGFANEITKIKEAQRFYGIISMGLNIAAVSAGLTSIFLSSKYFRILFPISSVDPWHQSVIFLTLVVMTSGLIIMSIYHYLTTKVLVRYEQSHPSNEPKGPKIRLSMRETFQYLIKSKYLIFIAIIVLAYNIIINLVEVVWKDQVQQLYPNPNDYNSYMGHITTVTGIISFCGSLFISGQSIRKCGWTFTALLTPAVLLITSIAFFTCFFGGHFLLVFCTSPLTLLVFFGSMQNCFSRAAKFTLYDATKEMAFIPLSPESRIKGKAVIDGIGSRLGKSGGSLIHQTLLVIFSSIAASAPFVAGMLMVVISIWIFAVIALGKKFNELTAEKEIEDTENAPPPATQPAIAVGKGL